MELPNSPPHYDVLCPACEGIFEDDAIGRLIESRKHRGAVQFHSSLSIVRETAKKCHLCGMIIRAFSMAGHDYFPKGTHLFYTLQIVSPKERQRHVTLELRARVCDIPGSAHNVYAYILVTSLASSFREKMNILGRRLSSPLGLGHTTLIQLQEWLMTCQTRHKECSDSWRLVSANRKLPTRLLNISGTWDTPKIVLEDTLFLPRETEYLSLSHKWGAMHPVQLDSKTHAEFSKSIPFKLLPKTLQDAIHLTQMLNRHYLWIDSLCIIQDSHDDWLHESSVMGEVYAHGLLNIAATASEDGRGGLFNQTCDSSTSPCLVETWRSESPETYMCYNGSPWFNNVENAPLGRRGWVVQERILSPRVVHFASDEIYWECCQERAAELLPALSINDDGELKKVAPYPGSQEGADPERRWVHQNWNKIVERYTTCDLTFDSDKLPAIAGLARRAARQLHSGPHHYLAGLWKTNLVNDLLWRVDIEVKEYMSVYRAPSWSWASINGSILTLGHRAEQDLILNVHVKIVSFEMDHDGDPFGPLKGGRLRIQGPFMFLALRGSSHQQTTFGITSGTESFGGTWTDINGITNSIMFDHGMASYEAAKAGETYLLIMLTCHLPHRVPDLCGLVLRPTKKTRGQFTRLGVMLYSRVQNLQGMLWFATDKKNLNEDLYQAYSPKDGFTIEII